MDTNVNMLFVGDFYQHTFDTSRDGNKNKTLFDDKIKYESRFTAKGIVCDNMSAFYLIRLPQRKWLPES